MKEIGTFVRVDNKKYVFEDGSTPNTFQIDGEPYTVEKLNTLAPGVHTFKINEKIIIAEVGFKGNDIILINIDGYTYEIEVQDETFHLLRTFAQNEEERIGTAVKLKAPMPGLVVKVLVSEGKNVVKGEKVVIIEAMKMENALASPTNGVVSKVFVNEGQTVEKDAPLVEIVVQ